MNTNATTATTTPATPTTKPRTRKARPWGDYAMRALACAMLFASGFALATNSPFALRMRDDIPGGVTGVAMAVSAFLAFVPLLFGRRFLAAFLVSSFLLAGIGAYWWTLIPWDELITESDFVTNSPASWWRYFAVAAPLVVAVLYVAASNASRLRADYKNRGADREEITQASCASFLAGMGMLVVTLGLSSALWLMLANGALLNPPDVVPRGVPALVLVAALLALAWGLMSGRGAKGLDLTRPWRAAAGLAARARSRARRSPS